MINELNESVKSGVYVDSPDLSAGAKAHDWMILKMKELYSGVWGMRIIIGRGLTSSIIRW